MIKRRIKVKKSRYEVKIRLRYKEEDILGYVNSLMRELGPGDAHIWMSILTKHKDKFTPNKIKGVHMRKSTGKYMARLTYNKKNIYLGDYETAAQAYESILIYKKEHKID